MVDKLEKLEKKLKKDPRNIKLLDILGCEYTNLDMYFKAQECWERLIALEPRKALWRARKGGALVMREKLRLALPHLKAALNLDRNCYDAWYFLGSAYLHLRKYAKAMEPLEQAFWLFEHEPTLYIWLGDAHRGLYLFEEAEEWYVRGMGLNPSAIQVSIFREEFESGESPF